MVKTITRWSLFAIALLAFGPVAWWLTSTLRAADGGAATTPILSSTPVMGLLRAIAAVLIAGLAGVFTARFVTLRSGMFAAGMVLAWAAAGSSTIDAVLRETQSPAVMWRLAFEAAVLAVPAIAAAWAIVMAAGIHGPIIPGSHNHDAPAPSKQVLAVALSFICALAGAWLIAQNTLKGQTVAAATFAGVAAAIVSTLVHPRTHPATMVGGILLAAIASPIIAVFWHSGGKGLIADVYAGHLLAPARLLPLDWIAGAFLGVPIGLSLGAWLAETRHTPEESGVGRAA